MPVSETSIIAIVTLVPYLAVFLFVVCFGVASFFIIYHFIRFGIGVVPKQAALIFFVGTLFLSAFAVITFTFIDWRTFFSTITSSLNALSL